MSPVYKKLTLSVVICLTAWGASAKLPDFRRWTSCGLTKNPFLDSNSSLILHKGDASEQRALIEARIGQIFSAEHIKGYAFTQSGKPIGLILGDVFYKEGEVLPSEALPELGKIIIKISDIRRNHLIVTYQREGEKGYSQAQCEITLPLPDLK